jgi:diguanylate cyclase (GGDEF)-like protein/PAS domain S-box-containing protein
VPLPEPNGYAKLERVCVSRAAHSNISRHRAVQTGAVGFFFGGGGQASRHCRAAKASLVTNLSAASRNITRKSATISAYSEFSTPMPGFKREQYIAIAALALSTLALSGLLFVHSQKSDGIAWGAGEWILVSIALVSACLALAAILRLPAALQNAIRQVIASLDEPSDEKGANIAPIDDLPALRELVAAVNRLTKRPRSDGDETAQLRRLIASMSEAIFVTDREGQILLSNPSAQRLVGIDDSQLCSREIHEVLANEDSTPVPTSAISKPAQGVVENPGGSRTFVSYLISELRADMESDDRLIFAAQNIDDRKKIEQRIRYLARTDPLTKMANRMQFQHYLQQGIARARRSRRHLAIMYLDLDRFKDINDTFGHGAGDVALEIFSQRLLDELPKHAVPGRLAGDEFAVLIGNFENIEQLEQELRALAQDVLGAVGRPFEVQGEEVFMTTSVGVASYPRDGDNVIDLIRNADAALYQAKKAGGNCYEFYSPDMNVEAVERLMLKSKLRRAFEHDELRLHYQPKYGLKSGRIEGVEALIRWDQPDHGLLFPSDFIPLAEETNLIVQVGDWVLDRVCSDYRDWQRVVPSPCRVSLNLSLRQLMQRRFLEKVKETFESHGVSPTCLELEITETTLMDDTDQTVRILDALYGMGLHLAIDDFGTGYSSLSALQQFPINTLKIDQSFVKEVAVDRDNAAIVRTIIQMGHSLGLEVVAEGVESEEQLAFLRAEQCDYAQGHLFGDPMTGKEFRDVLAADSEGSGKYRALFA